MIYYTTSKRRAERMASAVYAFTGWNASMFHDGRSWRVQKDDIGQAWKDAIMAYLAAGNRADMATKERVRPYYETMEGYRAAIDFEMAQ